MWVWVSLVDVRACVGVLERVCQKLRMGVGLGMAVGPKSVNVCKRACERVYGCASVCAHVCVCMGVGFCVGVCLRVCMFAYACVCVCVCVKVPSNTIHDLMTRSFLKSPQLREAPQTAWPEPHVFGVFTVFSARERPNIRSYTVCISTVLANPTCTQTACGWVAHIKHKHTHTNTHTHTHTHTHQQGLAPHQQQKGVEAQRARTQAPAFPPFVTARTGAPHPPHSPTHHPAHSPQHRLH